MATYNSDEFVKPSDKGQIPLFDENGKINTKESWNDHTMQEVEDFICRTISMEDNTNPETPPTYGYYVVDQRLNDILDDRFIIQHQYNKKGIIGNANTNLFTWIRKNTHRYVGKYENGIMRLKQLDDKDSTHFVDGSDATNYIRDKYNTGFYDVYVKFPCDIYVLSYSATTDKINITFYSEPRTNYSFKFDANTLIGAYRASERNSMLYSLSDKSISFNKCDVLKQYARNRGEQFTLIDYDSVKFLTLYGFGLYGRPKIEKEIGEGRILWSPNVKPFTGNTNSLGMTDSDITQRDMCNFSGLEDYIASYGEYLDNLLKMYTSNYGTNPYPKIYVDDFLDTLENKTFSNFTLKNGSIKTLSKADMTKTNYPEQWIAILDKDDNIVRLVYGVGGTGADYYPIGSIGKLNYGSNCDVFVKELGDFDIYGLSSLYDSGYISRSTGFCGFSTTNSGGSGIGSRLQFNGTEDTIQIINDNELL